MAENETDTDVDTGAETDADDAVDTTGADAGADDTDAGDADWSPPTKADWDALQKALKKARTDARQAKRTGAGKPDPNAKRPEDAAREAEEAAASKYRPVVIRQAARAAFAEAGLLLPKGREESALQKALKLLDTDDVDITDDGEVEGLREAVIELKADFPELFASRRTPRVDGADKGSGPAGKKSSAERIVEQLRG